MYRGNLQEQETNVIDNWMFFSFEQSRKKNSFHLFTFILFFFCREAKIVVCWFFVFDICLVQDMNKKMNVIECFWI